MANYVSMRHRDAGKFGGVNIIVSTSSKNEYEELVDAGYVATSTYDMHYDNTNEAMSAYDKLVKEKK